MEVSSSNYSFMLEKVTQESWQQFYLRAQTICRSLDRNPKLISEFEELKRLSHYYVAHCFMGCQYDDTIQIKLKKFFKI